MKKKLNSKGFSLVEMVVASVILSLAVVSICAVSSKSMTAVHSNRNYEIAWDLMDRQLAMIEYLGIEEFINEGQLSGHFGDEEKSDETVHYWSAEYEEGDYDYLYELKLSISWNEASRVRTITASTKLNGAGTAIETEETENEEGNQNNNNNDNDQPGSNSNQESAGQPGGGGR